MTSPAASASGRTRQRPRALKDTRLAADPDAPPVVRERVARMHEFIATLSTWYEQVRVLPKPTLVALMKLGGRVARFLPGKKA